MNKNSEKAFKREATLIAHMRGLEYQIDAGKISISCRVENCNKKIAVIAGGFDGNCLEMHCLCWEHFGKKENDLSKRLENKYAIRI